MAASPRRRLDLWLGRGALLAALAGGTWWSVAATHPALGWREGARLLAAGHYNAAVRALEDTVSSAPPGAGPGYDPAAARLALSEAYLALRDTGRAAAVLPAAAARPGLAPDIALQRALIAAVRGDRAAAEAGFRAVGSLASTGGPAAAGRSALWHLGELQWRAGRPGAETAFAALTAEGPADRYTAAAWLRLAEIRAPDGPEAARTALAAARAALPSAGSPAPRPDLHLPDLDLDEGLPAAAITEAAGRLAADLQGLAALQNAGPATRDLYWGRALAGLAAWPQAAPHLQAALTTDPTLADAHAYFGLARERLGDTRSAEAEYRTALRLAPDRDLARHLLARLLLAAHRPAEARPLLNVVLAHDPTNVVAHVDLADWAQGQGEYDLAARELQAAEQQQAIRAGLGLATPDESALNIPLLLAQLYFVAGAPGPGCSPALTPARQAVARQPGAAEYDALGWAQHLCADDAAARASLDRAVAADPHLAAARYHLGLVLQARGDPGARAALEAAQDLDPGGPWDRRALAAIVDH